MSIQGDQVVYDYLSRVGDYAHGKLTPARRATLVAELRARIEAERAEAGAAEPDQVRLLLQQLGEPSVVVADEVRRSPGDVVRRPERPAAPAPPAEPGGDSEVTRHVPPFGSVPPEGATPDQPPVGERPWWHAPELEREPGENPSASQPPVQPPAQLPPWPPSRSGPPAPDQVVVSVSPGEPGAGTEAASGESARSPMRELTEMFRGRNRRELLAVTVLFVGGVRPNLLVLVLGYLVMLTSRVWREADKRFVVFGVPLISAFTLAVLLWLQITGRIGGRPAGREVGDHVRHYLTTLTHVVGLVSAVFLAWRLTRVSRASRPGGDSPPR